MRLFKISIALLLILGLTCCIQRNENPLTGTWKLVGEESYLKPINEPEGATDEPISNFNGVKTVNFSDGYISLDAENISISNKYTVLKDSLLSFSLYGQIWQMPFKVIGDSLLITNVTQYATDQPLVLINEIDTIFIEEQKTVTYFKKIN